MPNPGSITTWIDGMRDGRSDATNGLWERYYRRLIGLRG